MIQILLATYNGARFLRQQMDSLLAQQDVELEILVHDDGSTDGTTAILAEYQDARIRVLNGEKIGSAMGNFIFLMEQADAPYLMFCDQDDIWLPDKAARTLCAMREAEADGKPILVFSDLCVVDEAGETIAQSFFEMQKLDARRLTLHEIAVQNIVTGCTVMINRALKELFLPSPQMLMHDWWLAMVAAAFGRIVCADNRILYRKHGSNQVGAKDVRSRAYVQGKLSNTQSIHEEIVRTYRQTAAFLQQYADRLDEGERERLQAFAQLEGQPILKRWRTLAKHGLFKSGLYRKVGQIIYG